MQKTFNDLLEGEFSFLKDSHLFLAISGGKDSMVLSHLLLSCGLKHTLLHCNFHLRGKESDEDQAFLENYAQENELEIHVEHFETELESEKRGLSIQETARELRYQWFFSFLKEEKHFLLTAHHLDDSIETFFINLLRGSGLQGLRGIPKIKNKVVRPLSSFKVEDIYQYIDSEGISYRKDHSNDENKYRRNKIRNTLLPDLRELEPQIQKKMASLFHEIDSALSYVDEQANKIWNAEVIEDNARIILPLELFKPENTFLLQRMLKPYGVHRKNIGELMSLRNADSGSKLKINHWMFLRDRETIILSEGIPNELFEIQIFNLPTSINSPLGAIELEQKNFDGIMKNSNIQQFELENIILPLQIRKWQQGDRIKPLGMRGSKLISDILIDKKVDLLSKESKLVMTDASGNVLSLVGIVVSEDYKITEDTKEILEVRLDQ
ncbi:MAG: tRNA lysidine(34) synthetase TilS [Flavobacteriales bacterium]|nr:tRNA lysidine(34) synthetase TilS [Flavobacteriales bacterium]